MATMGCTQHRARCWQATLPGTCALCNLEIRGVARRVGATGGWQGAEWWVGWGGDVQGVSVTAAKVPLHIGQPQRRQQ